MDESDYDPDLVEKAKKISSGPLGQEMAKFPLRFAKAAFFGERPSKSKASKVNHGTVTLLELKEKPIAITCSHVLDEYRKISRDTEVVFQIGNLDFNPLERIIDEYSELDLVSIDLKGLDLNELKGAEDINSSLFAPTSWPPGKMKAGDFVAFGGYPGTWRQSVSWNELIFDSYSSGACPVASVQENYFVCQFERDYWVETMNAHGHNGMDLHNLGGLSGGPVFILRELFWEIVGIIYEFSSAFDLMYVRMLQVINEEGMIIHR